MKIDVLLIFAGLVDLNAYLMTPGNEDQEDLAEAPLNRLVRKCVQEQSFSILILEIRLCTLLIDLFVVVQGYLKVEFLKLVGQHKLPDHVDIDIVNIANLPELLNEILEVLFALESTSQNVRELIHELLISVFQCLLFLLFLLLVLSFAVFRIRRILVLHLVKQGFIFLLLARLEF